MRDIYDQWVLDTFGVDPSSYPAKGASPAAVQAPAGVTPATPAAALTPQQWSDQNAAAVHALADAGSRVLMPGPAQAAQARLRNTQQTIQAALGAGNVQAASAALAQAQADVTAVNAPADAALGPVVAGKHPDQVLFGSAHPGQGDAADIAPQFAKQDGVGDCYLISTLGEIAKLKPDVIRHMVTDNGNGTYTVTFHKSKTGLAGLFASIGGGDRFEPVAVTVDSNFGSNTVNSQPGQAAAGDKHEIWAQVVEKAYAKLNGGYDKITHGGWPMNAMQTVTGKSAAHKPIASVTMEELQADFNGGKPVVLDTIQPPNGGSTLPHKLYGSHAYRVDGFVQTPQGLKVILKNPWGWGDPDQMTLADLRGVMSFAETGNPL